jgi:hypothetical protein
MLVASAFAALGIETDGVEAAAGAGHPPQSRGSYVANLDATLLEKP